MDDRLRGGSSTSHLEVVALNNELGARFHGTLDITTLGGAGFASQSYRHAVPLSADEYEGMSLVYQPNVQPGVNEPTCFTFILKSALAGTRPDGRRESTTSYEYTFDARSATTEKDISVNGLVSLNIPFREFKATYRGRPQPDAKSLNPAEIKEISIMCRSDFGKQSGHYELIVQSIGAVRSLQGSKKYTHEEGPEMTHANPPDRDSDGRSEQNGSPGVLAKLSSLFYGLCG